ncbi:MAG: Asp-tRNA(Asn)/Glu-tRNA(Gln) amidotransferase subunit GatC [Chlamydiales bacterium]|nr:Asp-tRNA(Asn)/Glu-tRNA(Gln) amidotransferase subunit GatC [Chlamydiales bacterium]NCF70498.1 Asp-tRNA(Asn)/Glu-tRNA(Gln) amidotransferase subunit GatC [Chlamydiales bacterium]
MTHFDKDMLDNLSHLCAIELSDEEKELFSKDLSKVVDYIEQLKEIDTEGVEPCDHVLEEMVIEAREDQVQEQALCQKTFLKNSPEHVGTLIKVPTVLD